MARAVKKTTGLKADIIASATGKGKEPVWTDKFAPPGKIELSRALSHYNSDLYKHDHYKAWALEYIREHHPHLVARANAQPAWYFQTFGALARMVARGMQTDSYINGKLEYFANRIPELVVAEDDDNAPKKPKKPRENAVMRAFDDALDEVLLSGDANYVFDFNASADPSPVIAYCQDQLAVIKEDSSQYPKHMKTWFKSIIDRLEKVKKAPKVRKPRVRKINPGKMVAKVKYLKHDAVLKLDSADPIQLVGAKKVYLYDTKYKRMTKLVCAVGSGFTVKGTTLQDFDAEKSTVTFFKKPERDIKKGMGIRELDAAMKASNSKRNPPATGRINENTIIMNVS